MSRVDIYNEDYVELNHAYVQIYKSYNRLLECKDADEDVLTVLREILLVFNPTLDRIKSEMTVRTRFKEDAGNNAKVVNDNDGTPVNKPNGKPIILHGNFTGE